MYIILIFLTGLMACQENYYFEETIELPINGWSVDDPISFEFNIVDSLDKFDLFLDVDHHTDYNYQNLYIKIDTEYPDKKLLSDTLSFDLANSFGNWNGKCSGESCNLRVFLAQQIRFRQVGDYKISISQHSRDIIVSHIDKLSIRLKQIKTEQ